MIESALQMPDLIHTVRLVSYMVGWRQAKFIPAIGGKRMARRPRNMSLEHIVSLKSRFDIEVSKEEKT